MQTCVLLTPPEAIPPAALARAEAVLRAGGLVAFPTETVYGLGACALDAGAVAGIYRAKGRPSHNPLIVHVADTEGARRIVADWPPVAEVLARAFWPGPLTLVLPRGPLIPDTVTGGGPTVAVRVPAHPVALALLRASALPLAAPSANRSNSLSPTRAEHVLRDLGGLIDLILDGGPTPGGIESTVLDLTRTPPRILRPGLVSPPDLERFVGPVERPVAREEGGVALPSPGMLARHYAPRTPLECVAGSGKERVQELRRGGHSVGWLTYFPAESAQGVVVEALPADAAGYAAELYAALHRLDGAGVERIVAAWPPEGEEWLGVRDRLRRASAG